MRTAAKVLKFPLSGVARDLDYRKAYIPAEETTFATPFASNVRGTDPFGHRARGGSRPGLRRVPEGVALKPIHPFVDVEGLGEEGEIMPKCSCEYRARVVCAADSAWYMSAIGNKTDWNFAGDKEDPSRAFSGNVALAGKPGEKITALIPIRDAMLFIATRSSLWVLNGDPIGGSIKCISENVGVVSADAWCFDGQRLWFVGENGLYACGLGEVPMLASHKLPEEMIGVESALLGYDIEENAVHIFTNTKNWFYEIDAKAFWQVKLYDLYLNSLHYADIDGVRKVVVYSYTRMLGGGPYNRGFFYFDKSAADDDGTPFASVVAIGPVRTGVRDDMDGMVGELMATTAKGSDDVAISIYTANSPEEVVSLAENAQETPVDLFVKGGWNNTTRPRKRGNWALFVVSAQGRWGFESMTAVMKTLGRLR